MRSVTNIVDDLINNLFYESKTLTYLGSILAAQIMAPLNALDLPDLFKSYKVLNIGSKDPETLTEVKLSKYSDSYYYYDPPFYFPLRTIIKLSGNIELVINDESHTVIAKSSGVLEPPYQGSGIIGVYLIGLPGLVFFSPLLILNSLLWKILEKIFRMNKYSLVLYLKIKNQLNTFDKFKLKQALRNNYDQRMG